MMYPHHSVRYISLQYGPLGSWPLVCTTSKCNPNAIIRIGGSQRFAVNTMYNITRLCYNMIEHPVYAIRTAAKDSRVLYTRGETMNRARSSHSQEAPPYSQRGPC